MKEGIHPEFFEATVTCGCGNTFTTGGRIEKFQKRYARK